jgi:hypothetical protein
MTLADLEFHPMEIRITKITASMTVMIFATIGAASTPRMKLKQKMRKIFDLDSCIFFYVHRGYLFLT